MKRIVWLTLLSVSVFANDPFKKPASPFRDVPIEEVAHSFFYSNSGIVSPMEGKLPNYNLGLGYRRQSGSKGFDLNINYDNCLVVLHSQVNAKLNFLYYFSPKMDEPQYYFGVGPSAVASVAMIKNQGPNHIYGCNLVLGREVPLNWVERKFMQLAIDVPVYGTNIKKRLPSFQLIFGRSF